MVHPCVLYSVAQCPSEADDFYQDGVDNIAGLAEWFNHVPDLFLLLMGGDAKPSPFAIYMAPVEMEALVCEASQGLARWQTFQALALKAQPALADSLATIDLALRHPHHPPHPYWVLDIWGSVPKAMKGKKKWAKHVQSLLDRCARLEAGLMRSDPQHIDKDIQHLLDAWPQESGYWSPKVVARISDIDHQPIEDLEGFEHLQETEYSSWLGAIPAYVVIEKGGEEDRSPMGVVTPYGRWLVPLSAGMTAIDGRHGDQEEVNHGWLLASACRGKHPNDQYDCILFDVNGLEVIPLQTDTVMSIKSATVGTLCCNASAEQVNGTSLVRLPSLEVLEPNISRTHYSEDGFIRFVREFAEPHHDPRMGLMTASGQKLLEADRYRAIGRFHPSKKIAIVERSHTDEAEHSFYGVINQQGDEIIPSIYLQIFPRTHEDQAPKLLEKELLVTIGVDNTLSIFKASGELVVATPYEPPLGIWFTGYKVIEHGEMLVKHGDTIWAMDTTGQLLREEYSVAELRSIIKEGFSKLFKKFRSVGAHDIIATDPWSDLAVVCQTMCLGDQEAADAVYQAVRGFVESPDNIEEGTLLDAQQDDEGLWYWTVESDQSAAAALLRMVFWQLTDHGYATVIDWKDSDSLGALADRLNTPALDGFNWDAGSSGDSMTDGIEAAQTFMARHGVHLFQLPPMGDMYELVMVRHQDKDALHTVLSRWGVGVLS